MEIKKINGKAIYNPSGKAGEYSKWACNFYVGCSNGCTYCYCKKGILAGAMGGNVPTLKKCFKNENHALEVFEKELHANLPELQKHGIFFSFSTDPCLEETQYLTAKAIDFCIKNKVSVKLLTKCVKPSISLVKFGLGEMTDLFKRYVAIGLTLTGRDDLEPNASTNAERIEAMRKLHEAGFKTWASIEPIIDFDSSLEMIRQTRGFCDLYKVGLESGKKYDLWEVRSLLLACYGMTDCKIYFKDSLLKAAGINREDLPANCVSRDYNMFND